MRPSAGDGLECSKARRWPVEATGLLVGQYKLTVNADALSHVETRFTLRIGSVESPLATVHIHADHSTAREPFLVCDVGGLDRLRQIRRVKAERAWLAFVENSAALADEIEPVRPARIG